MKFQANLSDLESAVAIAHATARREDMPLAAARLTTITRLLSKIEGPMVTITDEEE